MSNNTPHQEIVARAALPELMFEQDLALAVGLPVNEASAQAAAGSFGPFLFIGGRVAVLRSDFLAAMSRRASARDGAGKETLNQRAPTGRMFGLKGGSQ